MKYLLEPFVRFLKVCIKEGSQQWKVLVEVIASDRQCDATCEEANYSYCMPHPRPILARVLRQHNCPAWQRLLVLEQHLFVLWLKQKFFESLLEAWVLKRSNYRHFRIGYIIDWFPFVVLFICFFN